MNEGERQGYILYQMHGKHGQQRPDSLPPVAKECMQNLDGERERESVCVCVCVCVCVLSV